MVKAKCENIPADEWVKKVKDDRLKAAEICAKCPSQCRNMIPMPASSEPNRKKYQFHIKANVVECDIDDFIGLNLESEEQAREVFKHLKEESIARILRNSIEFENIEIVEVKDITDHEGNEENYALVAEGDFDYKFIQEQKAKNPQFFNGISG